MDQEARQLKLQEYIDEREFSLASTLAAQQLQVSPVLLHRALAGEQNRVVESRQSAAARGVFVDRQTVMAQARWRALSSLQLHRSRSFASLRAHGACAFVVCMQARQARSGYRTSIDEGDLKAGTRDFFTDMVKKPTHAGGVWDGRGESMSTATMQKVWGYLRTAGLWLKDVYGAAVPVDMKPLAEAEILEEFWEWYTTLARVRVYHKDAETGKTLQIEGTRRAQFSLEPPEATTANEIGKAGSLALFRACAGALWTSCARSWGLLSPPGLELLDRHGLHRKPI